MKDVLLITSRIMGLAAPAMISVAIGMLAILVNTRILGHIAVSNFYILALFIPINYFLISIYESLRASSLVLSSHLDCQSNKDEILSNVLSLFIFAIIVFIVATIFFISLKKIIMFVFNIDLRYEELFYNFSLKMIIIGLIVCLVYIISSTLYSLKKPILGMLLAILAAVSTCYFTYLFSNTWGLGINGYVASTAVAYLLTFLLAIILFKLIGLKLFSSNLNIKILREKGRVILRVGFPVGLAYFLLFSSLFFMNIILSHFGEMVLAGYGIAYRIQSVIIIPAISIGSAIAILINKHANNNEHGNAKKVFRTGMILALITYFIIASVTYVFRFPLSELITTNSAIIQTSAHYLALVSLSYIGFGPMIVYLTMLEQTGLGLRSLILNIFYSLLAIGFGGYMALNYANYDFLYQTISVVNIISLIYIFFIFIGAHKEIYRVIYLKTKGGQHV